MKYGVFCVPYALDYAEGKVTASDVIEWDLQIARWAEEFGLDEVFFAEHYTLGREPSPAPDLMIAAASQVTDRISLGALGHLLPYHNPMALAFRMMWLDHMTKGRYKAGVAPGAFPSDAKLFGTGKNNPEMMVEGLKIINEILTKEGPWQFEGKYWTADMPAYSESLHGPHLKPLQRPAFEMLMTGIQPTSPTLTTAAVNGYSPVSQMVATAVLRQHWETYSNAARDAGYEPDRGNWRIVRDWCVADTDEQARELAMATIGRTWGEHNLPTFKKLGFGHHIGGEELAADDLTVDWLIDNFFLVGSPDTVARKIRALYEEVGGFGTLLMTTHDRGDTAEAYRRSLELLGTEVAPQLADLKTEAT